MNILITGGAGFIGGNLIKRLLSESDHNIFNLDILSYASNLDIINEYLLCLSEFKRDNYTFQKVDIKNKKKLKEAINESNPDLVFHLAAESHVDRSIVKPDDFIQNNIVGTFNLLEELRDHWSNLSLERQKSFRFIHISTDEVFGSLQDSGYFSEASNYAPTSPYSSSKAASDLLVNAWNKTYNFPSIITNCCNNYGPGQFPEKLIPLAIRNALKGKEIPLYGNGLNIREWIYVDDHIDALLLIAKKGLIGESYCIGSGIEFTNKDLLDNLTSLLNIIKPSEIDYRSLIKFVKDRQGHDFRYALDSSKLKKSLGWRPKYDIKDGLKTTITWYLENI